MPTKNFLEQSLGDYASTFAGGNALDDLRGGTESGFSGISGGMPSAPQDTATAQATAQVPADPFAGAGPWLEDDDASVFERAHNLVLRCEPTAENHLALDTHYTRVKLGHSLQSRLSYNPTTGKYTCVLEQGTKALTQQAVPNKAWDLVNKATETLFVDPAQPDPSPLNDSDEAEHAADMAERFLTEDGGENGTNDVRLFYNAVDRALTCATSYIEGWVDPVGGGYVPLQILAHPQATDPANPMVGPDGLPSPNNVLRYVTAPEGGQFTTDPSQAAPQWQPKIMGTVWGREHWRIFPESVPVGEAEKVIGLLYCTIAQAKRRWPTVAQMQQDELDALLDWQPPRFTVLLPPFQRARWKVSDGGVAKEKGGSSDERIMFYYRLLQKASPDHPKGAEVIVSGIDGGRILHKDLLAATVQVPTSDPDGQAGSQPTSEVRCMDIPLVGVTPRDDPDDRDPSGRCYMELFSGATEFNSALATGFLEALQQWLHPESFIPSTSPVQAHQIEESRLSGKPVPIMRPEDKPTYGNQAALPSTFWQSVEWNDRQTDSIASLNKPVTGADDQQEVSGTARKIAVQQAMVGLNRMQQPVLSAHARWYRIKCQLVTRDFSTPTTLRYVGEDGSHKEEEFRGVDFALIGTVDVKDGTGTMLPPEQRVNFIATLKAEGMIPPDEAADTARAAFSRRLGLQSSPQQQLVERCATLWLKGPPTPEWVADWRQYMQLKATYDQAQAQFQQAQQDYAEASQNAAIVAAGPAQPTLGPESQNAQANTTFEAARLALAVKPLGPVPVAPQLQPPVMPFTPFVSRPNETEPLIAELWRKRLSALLSSAKYEKFAPEWRQLLDQRYLAARQAVALAAQPAQPPNGGNPQQANTRQPTHPQQSVQPQHAQQHQQPPRPPQPPAVP